MFYKVIVFALALLAGFLLHLLLSKLKVRVTNGTIIVLCVLGVFASIYGEGFLFFVGMILANLAAVLGLFRIFILMPKKANDAKFEKIVLKANSGSISEDEARSLLKKAIHYEVNGQPEDAKVLYELLVKSNTSFSSDAQSCLNNFK